MLDCALISCHGSSDEFGRYSEIVNSLFGTASDEALNEYLSSRGFTPLHNVLLGIGTDETLENFLDSSHRDESIATLITVQILISELL